LVGSLLFDFTLQHCDMSFRIVFLGNILLFCFTGKANFGILKYLVGKAELSLIIFHANSSLWRVP